MIRHAGLCWIPPQDTGRILTPASSGRSESATYAYEEGGRMLGRTTAPWGTGTLEFACREAAVSAVKSWATLSQRS
eukprot:363185-Chlamydomonas_euryale.AAC.9